MKTVKAFLGYFKFVFLVSLAVVVIMLATNRRSYIGPILIVMFSSLALFFMSHSKLKSFSFTAWVFAFVSVSMVYPIAFGTWFGFKLSILIVPLIQIIMFGMGTTLCLADFGRVFKMPWPVFIGLILQFSVMPLVGFTLATIFGFEAEVAAGIVLIGSCPGGVASNLMTFLAGGNVALSVTMTLCSTCASWFMTPFLMKTLAGQFIDVNFLSMMFSILNMIIVPILAGLIANRILYSKQKIYHSAFPVTVIGVVCLVLGFGMVFRAPPAVYTYDSEEEIEVVIKELGISDPNYALLEGLENIEFVIEPNMATLEDQDVTATAQTFEVVPISIQENDFGTGFILMGKDFDATKPNYAFIEDLEVIESLMELSMAKIEDPNVTVIAKGRGIVPIPFKKDGFVVGFLLIGAVAVSKLIISILMKGPEHWMDKVLPIVSMTGICLIIAIITAGSAEKLKTIGPWLILAAILHNAIGYVLGYWGARAARLDESSCRTVAIEVGLQNGGMASGLAVDVLKSNLAALAPAIFGPWMNISGSVLATWWRSKPVSQPKTQTPKKTRNRRNKTAVSR